MPETRLCAKLPRGVTLKDPLLLASGCCGYGSEYAEIVDPREIGGVITKAVSLRPREGNPPPRLRETPSGLLNCIGLQNPGVERFCADQLPKLAEGGFAYFINVVGESAAEFSEVIAHIERAINERGIDVWSAKGGFAGYELDLSCPNVKSGTQFATNVTLLKQTVSGAREATEALVIAKLSPNVNDIVPYARAAQEAGADCVTIANTWAAVSIDIATRRSHLARPSAGLSGPAIRPATLYHVWHCHRALPGLEILGCGGITDTDSALQYILAGATALEIGTGLFYNPRCPLEIHAGLEGYLAQHNVRQLAELIGAYDDAPRE